MRDIDRKLEKELDIICGLNSGFPLCCIDFFINIWLPAMPILYGGGIYWPIYSYRCGWW